MTPVRVNRAPVLTLWAAVVAERLGHPPETALSLASAVAGTAARAKARRLGIAEDDAARSGAPVPPRSSVELLGHAVPVLTAADGSLRAADGEGRPSPHEPALRYVERAFGKRLEEVHAAMRALAQSLPPEELNRLGFRLYEAFRPEVREGVSGWGAKGELRIERIRDAAGAR
ncbi:hypothetical protein [Falsiroseomonas oryziterrae]|uniref:hypothetical protein n=1 Tax=Falsiroseomonas oryziterrae TaxID=2911368 RepID=UPI001F3D6EA1|nr:hypothetical protein [Roseomonas sp. NPKOSM-4]